MPELGAVCVWTIPFPPVEVTIDTTNSPNVYFTTDCIGNGLNTNKLNSKSDIYPNPYKGIFNVKIENIQPVNAELKIFNSIGLQLLNEQIHEANGVYNGQFDLSAFPTGIYFLHIEGINGVINKQILIE